MKLSHWLESVFERVAAVIAGVATTHIQAVALKAQADVLAALDEQAKQLEERGRDGAAARLREQAAALSLSDGAALGALALADAEHNSVPALPDQAPAPSSKRSRRRDR